MSITRRATDKDATWQRAWTVTTAAELIQIEDSPGVIGPRHGDIAYAEDTQQYYLWRDDDTWWAMAPAVVTPSAWSAFATTPVSAWDVNSTMFVLDPVNWLDDNVWELSNV